MQGMSKYMCKKFNKFNKQLKNTCFMVPPNSQHVLDVFITGTLLVMAPVDVISGYVLGSELGSTWLLG